MDKLMKLRDDLAHAQDILAGRWPELADLAVAAENILEQAEKIDAERARVLCAPTAE